MAVCNLPEIPPQGERYRFHYAHADGVFQAIAMPIELQWPSGVETTEAAYANGRSLVEACEKLAAFLEQNGLPREARALRRGQKSNIGQR